MRYQNKTERPPEGNCISALIGCIFETKPLPSLHASHHGGIQEAKQWQPGRRNQMIHLCCLWAPPRTDGRTDRLTDRVEIAITRPTTGLLKRQTSTRIWSEMFANLNWFASKQFQATTSRKQQLYMTANMTERDCKQLQTMASRHRQHVVVLLVVSPRGPGRLICMVECVCRASLPPVGPQIGSRLAGVGWICRLSTANLSSSRRLLHIYMTLAVVVVVVVPGCAPLVGLSSCCFWSVGIIRPKICISSGRKRHFNCISIDYNVGSHQFSLSSHDVTIS